MKKLIIYGLIAALLAGVFTMTPASNEETTQSYSMCDLEAEEISY